MNSRLYDPVTGRFLSADPTIQYPDEMQNYNRYSYINNNPLSAVDYSGYGWLRKICRVCSDVTRGLKKEASKLLRNNIVRTGLAIAAAYYTGVNFMGTGSGIFGAGHAIANGAVGGFAAGLVGGRGDLKAALNGAIAGAAFGWAGGIGEADSLARYAAHVFAGCAGTAIGGGDCGHGAMSAVAGKYITNNTPANWDDTARFVAATVGGGLTSMIGGGKFDNGAMTAAFGYLFNRLQSGRTMRAYMRSMREQYREDYANALRQKILEINPNARIRETISAPNSADSNVELYERGFQREVTNAASRAQYAARRDFIDAVRSGQRFGDMTFSEAAEIARTGRADGWVMHHINSVARYPEQAGDVNNIEPMTRQDRIGYHHLFGR